MASEQQQKGIRRSIRHGRLRLQGGIPMVLGLLALVAGCSRESSTAWQGYAEADYVLVAAPAAGQLVGLRVRRGDEVKAGQPLFVLEQESETAAQREAEQRVKSAEAKAENLRTGRRTPELEALRAQLAQAQAAAELSASQLAQSEKLRAQGFISQAQFDAARSARERDLSRIAEVRAQIANAGLPLGRDAERGAARADVEASRAALAQAQWRLRQKTLAAPVDARVHDHFFNAGEWVPAGRPVVALLPPRGIKARFYVPETALASLSTGQAVELSCDGCQNPIPATVSFISTQAEYTPPVLYNRDSRARLVYLVEARPDAPASLKPGQPLEVRATAR